MSKGTPPQKRRWDSTLIVFKHISSGLSPCQLWKKKTLTKDQVKYALTTLRQERLIEKIGYGTWEAKATELPKRRWHKIHRVAKLHTPPEGVKPDTVRGHGYQVVVRIPKIKNWKTRRFIFDKINPATKRPYVKYTPIPQGERISFMGVDKIWLTNTSLVFYLPHSWYADKAPQAVQAATFYLIDIIKKLEKRLGVPSFKMGKGYQIKFSRKHHSLIKNALARQYDAQKEKLFVYDEKGLWLIIDNSYNLHELETVHPETSVEDNVKVQNFFNSLKKTPITADFVLNTLGQLGSEQLGYRQDLTQYGAKIAAHGQSIESLGTGIQTLTGAINEFKGLVREFAGDMKKTAPEDKKYEFVNVEFLKPNPEFVGIIAGKVHTYTENYFKKGQRVYIEKLTAEALEKNGFARILEKWWNNA